MPLVLRGQTGASGAGRGRVVRWSAPSPASQQRAIKFLSRESELPMDEVAQLYESEIAELSASASIKSFVPIFCHPQCSGSASHWPSPVMIRRHLVLGASRLRGRRAVATTERWALPGAGQRTMGWHAARRFPRSRQTCRQTTHADRELFALRDPGTVQPQHPVLEVPVAKSGAVTLDGDRA